MAYLYGYQLSFGDLGKIRNCYGVEVRRAGHENARRLVGDPAGVGAFGGWDSGEDVVVLWEGEDHFSAYYDVVC